MFDPEYRSHFIWNPQTQESQWDEPWMRQSQQQQLERQQQKQAQQQQQQQVPSQPRSLSNRRPPQQPEAKARPEPLRTRLEVGDILDGVVVAVSRKKVVAELPKFQARGWVDVPMHLREWFVVGDEIEGMRVNRRSRHRRRCGHLPR